MSTPLNIAGLKLARELASLSPQTEAKVASLDLLHMPAAMVLSSVFTAIGQAVASKRDPITDKNLKRLFDRAEQLFRVGDPELANSIATDMLEAIWTAAQNSGFDFSRLDPHLGREARSYLLAWDDFNKTKTPGLTRK